MYTKRRSKNVGMYFGWRKSKNFKLKKRHKKVGNVCKLWEIFMYDIFIDMTTALTAFEIFR